MMQTITYVAVAAESADTSLLGSLGIDWKLIIFQIVAFGLLLWLLSKYVFPIIVKSIDDREAKIAEGQRLADEAVSRADAANEEIAAMMKSAKKEAAEIVSNAKEQTNQMIADSDKKAKERAERIVDSARDDITREVANAKKALLKESIELVALATEKVTSKAVSKSVDEKTISAAIKEASK